VKSFELRWIARAWRSYPFTLVALLLGTLAGAAASVSVPLVLRRLFDGFLQAPSADALGRSVRLYLLASGGAWALGALLMALRGPTNLRFERSVRHRVWSRLVHRSPGFFLRTRTGDLVTRLTDDVSEKLCWFLCSGIFRTVAAGVTILFAIVMMVRLDPWLTLVTAAPLTLLVWLLIRAGTLLDRRFAEVQERISALNNGIEACFSGIRVVKASGREETETASFAVNARSCRQSEIASARSQLLVNALYGQVWQVGVVAVLLAGGLAVMRGRLTLGTFVAFEAYALLLVFPMLDIGTFFVRGWQGGVSIGRLREIEEGADGVRAAGVPARREAGCEPTPLSFGRLSFERVGYRPDEQDGRAVLSDVSFELRPGEMVAVAGAVGSGKSFLLRLPPRLMDPTEGRLLIDGTDLRELPLDALRRSVGWVPQEAILFSESIRNNIRFDRPWVTDERVESAAEAARLQFDLDGFRDGLDTVVGVRGVSLSGGQRQRVALARALAGRPALLVLDDATSSLDLATEAALWDELRRLLPGMAVLLATHRTATLERADRIVVLEAGRVVESGTHARLSVEGSRYQALYRRHRVEERLS
jgi:ATP-binding cassette subfamily B protein